MAFSLKAILGLETSQFERGIGKAKSGIKGMASEGIKNIARLGAAFVGIGLVKNILSLGLAATETADKFNAVFGPAAGAMNKRIEELQETIPASVKELQDALAVFGQMASSFGLNSAAAQDFSVNMVKIAGDLASFNDMKPEEVFIKLRSAITGEFEPLKQMGIMIDAAKMKTEAFNLGISDGVTALSSSQKAIAIQSLIVQQMGAASGNAAITANSAANQFKFLQRNMKDLAAEIGTEALPAVESMIRGIGFLLSKTKEFTDFAGTKVGEMIYGPSAETLAKQEKFNQLKAAQLQALRELTAENELYKQGTFEGTLWTKGLSEKLDENKAKIKARTAAILKGLSEEAEKTESVKDGIVKGDDEINEGKDEISESQKKINEANDALLKSINDQIEAQGEFAKQQEIIAEAAKSAAEEKAEREALQAKLMSMKLAALKAETRGEDQLAKAMNNRIKLAERILKIMKETGATQREATIIANKQVKAELAGDSGSTGGTASGSTGGSTGKDRVGGVQGNFGGYGSRFGPKQTMDERERAAGLNLAGNDTLSGRRGPESLGMAGSKAKSEFGEALTPTNKELSKMNRSLKTIETELTNGN